MTLIKKYRRESIVLLVELFVVIPMIAIFSLNCAHTVDYETQHDTDTVIHHDTLHPGGPAFIRFLAVLQNGGFINLSLSPGSSTPFTSAEPTMSPAYFTVRSDTSVTYYASFHTVANQFLDSVNVPGKSLKAFSLTTIVLFQTNGSVDTGLFPFFGVDSLKNVLPPVGMCYLRLVNGISDYPTTQPAVNLHLDSLGSPPLFSDPSGNDAPVFFQSMHNYVLIPAGSHLVYATSETNKSESYLAIQNFASGKYYTAILNGLKSQHSDTFVIDEE